MSGINPRAARCRASASEREELDHDFLWRTPVSCPSAGALGIFNRSYYEEVLIVRVHPEILRAEKLPDDLVDPDSIWKERFRSITGLEDHLCRNGTHILNSSSIFRRRNSASASSRASTSRTRTGNQPRRHRGKKVLEAVHEAYEECLAATSPGTRLVRRPADDKPTPG